MSHKSRLGCLVIDCKGEELSAALEFWSKALGRAGKVDDDGKYAVLDSVPGEPEILLQAVDHDSRVHLDIESDDKEAEAARLEALGARRITAVRNWIVLEAPTGHRFCVVQPQRSDFPGTATTWEST